MFSPIHLCLSALTASSLVVSTSSAALAQRLHPAERAATRSVTAKFSTSIRFINPGSVAVKIYWLNYEGERVFYNLLQPGEEYIQQTYLTHPWLITDVNDNALYIFFPDAQSRTVEIRP